MNTPYAALSEMATMFLAVYPYPERVELPNKPYERARDIDTFAAITFEHTDMGQATLANSENKRRYTNEGVCIIEMFFPVGRGIDEPYRVAELVMDAYRGKRTPSDVWFRDVRVIEHSAANGNPPRIAGTYQLDVAFSFTYDQFS